MPARRPRDMALVCVLALFALVAGDCQPGSSARSGRIAPLAVSVSHIPDPGLRTDESIDAFDFVTDESGSLHFVWSARRSDSGKPWNKRTEVWYQRGDQGGTRWTRPFRLEAEQGWGAGPRIVIAGDRLHVLFGYSLRHWVSEDRGGTWSALPMLIEGHQLGAKSFDLLSLGDGSLLVAFLAPGLPLDNATPNYSSALYVMRWSENGTSTPRALVQVDHGFVNPPTPRLALHRDRVHVVAGFRELLTRVQMANGRSTKVSTSRGRLFCTATAADSVLESWGSVEELPLPSRHGSSLGDLTVLTAENRLALFFCAYSLYFAQVDTGRVWSQSTRLTSDREPFTGSYESSSVGVARAGHRSRLVWIDARYRKSDRSLLNPLGGIPWSDSPEWRNNDVFTARLPDRLDSLATSGLPEPERLTQPLSQAQSVVIRALGERFCVAWNGRAKVGHGVESYGERPKIFFTLLSR